MGKQLSAFWNDEAGQDLVEYTLLIAFAAFSGVGVMTLLRSQTVNTWQAISNAFSVAAG